jgi:hypothetical protein
MFHPNKSTIRLTCSLPRLATSGFIAQAVVEDDAPGRVDPGHLVEERPADEVPREPAGDQAEQLLSLPGGESGGIEEVKDRARALVPGCF